MRRWIVRWGLIALWLVQTSQAQEFKAWNRTVQVHGFFSQGFVYTDQNNWLTMNTSKGSGAMTDMGLNISSQLTDKLRVGAQVYDRNLGQLGKWHPSLDWAVADYRLANWMGIRGGKVKTTFGLYTDSQDLDFLHVFALLPQGVYPTDLRDTSIAHKGGDIYGNIALPHRMGELSYTAFAGWHSESIYGGYAYLISQWGIRLRDISGSQIGADLRWNAPISGLTLGVSRMNQKSTPRGVFFNPLLAPGSFPYETSTEIWWSNRFYGRYQRKRLDLSSEYQRYYLRFPPVAGSEVSSDARSWYISGSYRIHKRLSVGSYYSHYAVTRLTSGVAELFLPTTSDTSLPQNHVYDTVVASRLDLNRFLYMKVEAHFIDGYGSGPYPNGFYPQQNPRGLQRNTKGVVVKMGFHF